MMTGCEKIFFDVNRNYIGGIMPFDEKRNNYQCIAMKEFPFVYLYPDNI